MALAGPLFLLPREFAQAAWETDIGFTQLRSELAYVPTGVGVPVSQVEAEVGDAYLPDRSNSEFAGKTIQGMSGGSSASSSHATAMGRLFYGNASSIAPGVSNVSVYEAGDFLSHTLGNAATIPPAWNYRVQNHSWVGSGSPSDRSQRLDYSIDHNETTTLVALANSTGPVPALLAHSYNALAVGRSDGNHSYGQTGIYGSGRTKPSLVAPGGSTSAAAAMTSSAAALLHEAAGNSGAARSETMRAILLAGATKTEFSGWSRTTTAPLDPIYGAGELNVRNSFYMVADGQYAGSAGAPSQAAPETGWDYRPVLSAGEERYYDFVVPKRKVAGELSLVLSWNALISDANGSAAGFFPEESLANMNLRFYDSSSGFLGQVIDASRSAVDNIEHIYQTDLAAGRYTLEVSTDTARDYGLAWRMSLYDVADTDRDADVDTIDITKMFQNFTGDVGAVGGKTIIQGDTDQDGDVDTTDITVGFQSFTGDMSAALAPFADLRQEWSLQHVAAAQAALGITSNFTTQAVPEPSALVLLLLGIAALLSWRLRCRTRRLAAVPVRTPRKAN